MKSEQVSNAVNMHGGHRTCFVCNFSENCIRCDNLLSRRVKCRAVIEECEKAFEVTSSAAASVADLSRPFPAVRHPKPIKILWYDAEHMPLNPECFGGVQSTLVHNMGWFRQPGQDVRI